MAGEYLKWENEFNTGDPKIDQAHQQVIKYINQLYEALRTQEDEATINEIIKGLTENSYHHFKLEEEQMANAGYPSLGAHKEEHQIFTDRLKMLTNDMQKKNKSVNLRLLKFLKAWFSGHILHSDKKFMDFLSQGNNGKK